MKAQATPAGIAVSAAALLSAFSSLRPASWDTDHPPPDAWPLGSYRMVKVLVFLWDVPLNGGELALVPGSHRLPAGPGEVLQTRFKDGMGAHPAAICGANRTRMTDILLSWRSPVWPRGSASPTM